MAWERRRGRGRPPGVTLEDSGQRTKPCANDSGSSAPSPGGTNHVVGPPARGALPVAAAWSRRLVIATVLTAGGLAFLAPATAAPVVLVVAGVGFLAGVPHGAVDHLLAMRLTGGRPVSLVTAAYAGLAVAAWASMWWAGPIALGMVVLLSAVHFGLGELEVSRQLTGWHPGRVPAAAIVIAGSGALVLPLARSGDQLTGVATAISPVLAKLIGAAPIQIGLAVTWLIAAVIAVTASLRSGHRSVALDIALIGALGLLVAPLVAFAVWFGGWHALRHTARILTVEPGCAALMATARPRAAVLRLARLAALPSAAALTTVAALVWFTAAATDPTVAVAEVLRLLLALTVPHMVVVLYLDRTTVPKTGHRRATQSHPRHPRIPSGWLRSSSGGAVSLRRPVTKTDRAVRWRSRHPSQASSAQVSMELAAASYPADKKNTHPEHHKRNI